MPPLCKTLRHIHARWRPKYAAHRINPCRMVDSLTLAPRSLISPSSKTRQTAHKESGSTNIINLLTDSIMNEQQHCKLYTGFSHLPIEIRLQIWKLSLPDPRLIEIYPDFFSSLACRRPTLSKHGNWVTSSDPVKIPLLQVNKEARNTALESYQKVVLCDRKHVFLTSFYIDLKRDTVLCTKNSFESLLQHQHSSTLDDLSRWIYKVRNIGIPVRDHGFWSTRFHHFLVPQNDISSLRQLSEFCSRFPHVQRLYFIIDGRDKEFKGSEELAEATEEFEELSDLHARRNALGWVLRTYNWLRQQYPERKIPEMGLRLLIDGRECSKTQRSWIYQLGVCSFMTQPGARNNGYETLGDLDWLFQEKEKEQPVLN
jgi:hypothetical protein